MTEFTLLYFFGKNAELPSLRADEIGVAIFDKSVKFIILPRYALKYSTHNDKYLTA